MYKLPMEYDLLLGNCSNAFMFYFTASSLLSKNKYHNICACV